MRANEVEAFDEELARLDGADDRRSCTTPTGVGLAATQVGILRRLFVFSDEDEDRVVVNPVLTVRGKETEVDEEGCLSLGPDPDAGRARGRGDARRRSTPRATPSTSSSRACPARVVQHELDHLDGKLIIDRTDPESRREAMAQLRPRLVLSR